MNEDNANRPPDDLAQVSLRVKRSAAMGAAWDC